VGNPVINGVARRSVLCQGAACTWAQRSPCPRSHGQAVEARRHALGVVEVCSGHNVNPSEAACVNRLAEANGSLRFWGSGFPTGRTFNAILPRFSKVTAQRLATGMSSRVGKEFWWPAPQCSGQCKMTKLSKVRTAATAGPIAIGSRLIRDPIWISWRLVGSGNAKTSSAAGAVGDA